MLYEFTDRYGQSWAIEMPEGGVGVLRSPLNPEQPLTAADALGSEVLRLVAERAVLRDRVTTLEAENAHLEEELHAAKAYSAVMAEEDRRLCLEVDRLRLSDARLTGLRLEVDELQKRNRRATIRFELMERERDHLFAENVRLRADLAAAIKTGEEQATRIKGQEDAWAIDQRVKRSLMERLFRLDALLSSEQVPEGLFNAIYQPSNLHLLAEEGEEAAKIAWRWFREQLGEKHS